MDLLKIGEKKKGLVAIIKKDLETYEIFFQDYVVLFSNYSLISTAIYRLLCESDLLPRFIFSFLL